MASIEDIDFSGLAAYMKGICAPTEGCYKTHLLRKINSFTKTVDDANQANLQQLMPVLLILVEIGIFTATEHPNGMTTYRLA